MGMAAASDRWHYPIPPDPNYGPCQVEHRSSITGDWVNCGEDAYEEVADTLMCQGHIDDHYRSEQADMDRKRMKGE